MRIRSNRPAPGARRGQCRLSRSGYYDDVAALGEHARGHHLVDRIVLGDENAQLVPAVTQRVMGDDGRQHGSLGRHAENNEDGVEQHPLSDGLREIDAAMPSARQRAPSRRCPADVSIMTIAGASAGSFLISSATENPSMPGICASSTTSGKAVPASWQPRSAATAACPLATSTGFMSQRPSVIPRISRLTALSSTTRTGRSRRRVSCASRAVVSAAPAA